MHEVDEKAKEFKLSIAAYDFDTFLSYMYRDEASDAFYLAVYMFLHNSTPLESSASLRGIAS